MNPLLAALVQAGLVAPDDAKRIARQLDSTLARSDAEAEMLQAWQVALSTQRDRLVDAVRANDGFLTAAQSNKLWADENDRLWQSVRGTILDLASERATVAAIHGGNVDMWHVVNDHAVAYAEHYYTSTAADNVGSIPNLNITSRQSVGRIIAEWQQGILPASGMDGLPELIHNLTPVFGASRAQTIGVTETSRIFADSERQAAIANPFVTHLLWQTANDEMVCFPAGTMVTAQEGSLPIEQITVGAKVLTRQGYRTVIATSKRLYSGPMTWVRTDIGSVLATSNHPVWTSQQGWLECGKLTAAHSVQARDDQQVKILDVLNFRLGDSAHLPTARFKKDVFAHISLDFSVPIIPINLKGDAVLGQQEIDAVPSHFRLLNVFNALGIKSQPDLALQLILSAKAAVASKATKLAFVTRDIAKFFAAMPTVFDKGWASAFLGTIVPIETLFAHKRLAATFTGLVLGVSDTAFVTANGVAVSDGGRYGERLAASWADLFDQCGRMSSIKTSARAKLLVTLGACWRKIELSSASLAISIFPVPFALGLSESEFSRSGWHGFPFATDIYSLYHGLSAKPIYVYDIQVDEVPEFYANGILVHNCPICGPLADQTVGKETDGFQIPEGFGFPPAHVNCRCGLSPLTSAALEALGS